MDEISAEFNVTALNNSKRESNIKNLEILLQYKKKVNYIIKTLNEFDQNAFLEERRIDLFKECLILILNENVLGFKINEVF